MPEDHTFTKLNHQQLKALGNDFDHCQFRNCDLSYAELSGIRFGDCGFTDCNLLLATVEDTAWQNVLFTGCKLSGIHFNKSSKFLFELHFTDCLLDNAIFYQTKNKKSRFTRCSLIEADFTEADLTAAVFNECNFERTTFSNTLLNQADLSTSYNFIIDPENNRLNKAKFSLQGLPGLLMKHNITIKY